jgi:hypothetical protein
MGQINRDCSTSTQQTHNEGAHELGINKGSTNNWYDSYYPPGNTAPVQND